MSNSLLLVTHVPIRKDDGEHFIDDQTALGIAQWCRHFDKVTYIGVESTAAADASSSSWISVTRHPALARCQVFALPNAYRLADMLRHYQSVRCQLGQAIASHDHLCFTIGGLIGDWPAIAAIEALKQKQDYVAWVDRVEPEIIRRTMAGAPLKRRVKCFVTLPLMDRYQRFILRRSKAALLQGMDTYDYFASDAPNPHCIYDTHATRADQIDATSLAAKMQRILAGAPLEIVYTGRAAAMKGTSDWLGVLEQLDARGVPFQAKWVGDGPELQAMRQRVKDSGLHGKIELPGFEGDRTVLLGMLRQSDMLLFCHKTPESPRCLIEAIISGCPLVGYDSAYARGLVATDGGAVLTRLDDIAVLASEVEALHHDRRRLASLVEAATRSGTHYDEDNMYEHRARLMGAKRMSQLAEA